MATIDALTIALSTLPSPLTKENQTDLTITATTKNNGSAANADRVEFILGFAPVPDTSLTTGSVGPGLLIPVANATMLSNDGTAGEFQATFTADQFAAPGAYQVTVKAFTLSGGLITVQKFAISDVFYVSDANQADQFNLFTDEDKAKLEDGNFVLWETATMSGAELKAATGANSGTSKTIKIATLPLGAIFTGGSMVVNTADAGAATTTTATLGANSSSFNEVMGATDLRTAAETGVSASFVPNAAGGTDLKSVVAVTGSGITIADIDDTMSVTFNWAYAVPKAHTLGN